jgi:hypothetical protein
MKTRQEIRLSHKVPYRHSNQAVPQFPYTHRHSIERNLEPQMVVYKTTRSRRQLFTPSLDESLQSFGVSGMGMWSHTMGSRDVQGSL